MSDTLVKNRVCSKCGEDARPQAQFCFACGGSIVGPEDTVPGEEVSSAWFRGEIVDSSEAAGSGASEAVESGASEAVESGASEAVESGASEAVESDTSEAAGSDAPGTEVDADVSASPAETELEDLPVVKVSEEKKADAPKLKVGESEVVDRPAERKAGGKEPLKSAAELRRRPKPVRSKQVEIVWSERRDSPNVVFLVFGLVFVAISALLLFLALYFK